MKAETIKRENTQSAESPDLRMAEHGPFDLIGRLFRDQPNQGGTLLAAYQFLDNSVQAGTGFARATASQYEANRHMTIPAIAQRRSFTTPALCVQ